MEINYESFCDERTAHMSRKQCAIKDACWSRLFERCSTLIDDDKSFPNVPLMPRKFAKFCLFAAFAALLVK